MKILVGYDGSGYSEAALDDLVRAGLPAEGEMLVMSVAEVWLPPPVNAGETEAETDPYIEKIVEKHRERARKAIAEAETLANHAKQRLQKAFSGWNIESEATFGSPAWEILTKESEYKPDLIVVGSHGRSAVGRFFLGSISNKVLTEARCSVRVARGRVEVDPEPSRIIIGFDGSSGAQAAVEAVAARNWREGSEFRLLAVTDPLLPTSIGMFVPPVTSWVDEEMQSEREWIENFADSALKTLREAGYGADLQICSGNPKKAIVEEAEKWHADSIFVGANAFGSRVERFLIGSTSAAVAARAHCTVEVVRKAAENSGTEIPVAE